MSRHHLEHPHRATLRHITQDDELHLAAQQAEMHERHNDQPVNTPVCPGCCWFAIGNLTRDENGTLWHSDCLGRRIAKKLRP